MPLPKKIDIRSEIHNGKFIRNRDVIVDAIAQYSNNLFYSGMLRVATDSSKLNIPKGTKAGIHWTKVNGPVVSAGKSGCVSESEVEIQIDTGNTRTSLYQEVLWSIQDKGTNFLFGGGASAGYQTDAFYNPLYIITTTGRYQAEVAFLNTLFKAGIVGVIFDMLIFCIPAYFAINQSNNNFTKILGLYLFLSWILYFIAVPEGLNVRYFFHYLILYAIQKILLSYNWNIFYRKINLIFHLFFY